MSGLSWHNRHFAELRKKEEEDQEKTSKFKYMLAKKAEAEAKEHRRQITNVCPHCHISLNYSGECMMGCGYKKPKK
jgi:hypothetical protein